MSTFSLTVVTNSTFTTISGRVLSDEGGVIKLKYKKPRSSKFAVIQIPTSLVVYRLDYTDKAGKAATKVAYQTNETEVAHAKSVSKVKFSNGFVTAVDGDGNTYTVAQNAAQIVGNADDGEAKKAKKGKKVKPAKAAKGGKIKKKGKKKSA